MDDPGLPSIQLEDIDPEHCYFNPGCAMSLYKPEAVEDILYLLNRRFLPTKLHTTCCRHDPNLPKGSTIIIKPISSHSSTNSGAGMLWEVRMASHPISLSRASWWRNAARLTAEPKGPKSWWLHTPLNFRSLPLR